jgi:hypothetical protein
MKLDISLFFLIVTLFSARSYAYVGGFQPPNKTLIPLVGLDLTSEVYCSGAFISPTKILTAAHCITGSKRSEYLEKNIITLHFNIYNNGHQMAVSKWIKNIYIHPSWPEKLNASESGDDIRVFSDLAIIELDQPAVVQYFEIQEIPVEIGSYALQGGFGMDNVSGDRSRAWGDLRMDWKKVQLQGEYVFGFDSTDSKSSQQTHGDSGGAVLFEDPVTKKISIVGVNSVSKTDPLGWFFKEDWCARINGERSLWIKKVLNGEIIPTRLSPLQ